LPRSRIPHSRGFILAFTLTLSLAVTAWCAAGETRGLQVQPVAPPEQAARLRRLGIRNVLDMRPDELRAQSLHERRWRDVRDIQSRPGVDWSPRASRRVGWHAPVAPLRGPKLATSAQDAAALTPPDTLRVAFLRVDFASDRGGDASSGDGHFDLTPPDTTQPPIDRAPHNRTFYLRHLEALKRYYDVQSYGRTIVEGDVWPHDQNGAYTVGDMADLGPWQFSQDIYGAAVRMYRTFLFAADSQSIARGDRIPWDQIDRIVIIHAGGDLQSDVRQDSKEDIPSFTIGVGDTDRVIFPDSTTRPIDRATLVPETTNQDGYFGALNGVIAHECGHLFFGFADLYDIETGRPIVGYWSLMDSGNLVGSRVGLADGSEIFATGLLPPSVDPWQRFFTGDALSFPEVAYGDTVIALANGERQPDMKRVTLSSDEYLLLENRYLSPANIVELDQDSLTRVVLGPKSPDRFEYDALLPGSGILVWHIDESVIPFSTSLRINPDYGFNTNPDRLAISVIEGDGLADLGDPSSPYIVGAPFDPWFVNNNPLLDDTSHPNLLPHIGTRPHRRLDFLDDPAPVMHFLAHRAWELPGWPVVADFPAGGPILLAVDADGDRDLDVCWAGGRDSLVRNDSVVVNPDRDALFAIRPNGHGLDSTFAFAHLDHPVRPVLAALPTGEPGVQGSAAQGPAYFAVTTYAEGPDTSAGGRVWLLDHHGQPLPGWPAPLPVFVTTPPVIAGTFPNAFVFVGAVDGLLYVIGLDGTIQAVLDGPSPTHGAITGRLAVTAGVANPNLFRIGAGTVDGWIGAEEWQPLLASTAGVAPPTFTARHIGSAGFSPDLLWIPLGGAGANATTGSCGNTEPNLIVHDQDRLWAFCSSGEPLAGWGRDVGDTLVAALGAGDPDGDGVPEVLTQSLHSELTFWNRGGYPSPGWPRRGTREDLRTDSPPLALDVDDDHRSEIVGMNASGIVAALRSDGRTPDGWPLATGSGATGSPVAADLDRNRSLEIVAPDRFRLLYAYTLGDTTFDPIATSWTMLGGDAGRSSALQVASTPTAPAASAGPLVAGSLKAYPNPARRHPVSFAYKLTEPAEVEFRILDSSGHEVASFTRLGQLTDNLEVWDPGRLPSGLYLARLRFRGAGTEHTQIVPVALLR
jgi:M6 family metalloprotease-like protein